MKFITTLSIALLLVLSSINLFGQYARFPVSGVIEYEKTINMPIVIKKAFSKRDDVFLNLALDHYNKKDNPKFKKVKSTLSFFKDRTLFTPAVNTESSPLWWETLPIITQNNTVFNDLSSGLTVTQKKVYEQIFLVKDSIRKINWKITDETREIAGYTCRRANALVMDSVYTVAFYTTEIPVSGGPEIFSGLPGMILGVALPHENITWFATSVTEKAVSIVPPTKGKVIDKKGLFKTIQGVMKNWGEYAELALKAFML